MVALLFATRLVEGRTESFDMVPIKLQAQVAKILIEDFGLPELVPEGFGVKVSKEEL